MNRGRGVSLVRLLKMARELERSRYRTIHGLASTYAVSSRTIRRDLIVLSEAGLPVRCEFTDGKKRWWIERDWV